MSYDTRIFSTDYAKFREEVIQELDDLKNSVNETIDTWTPTIKGSGAAGTGTYTVQNGWYLRKNLVSEIVFIVQWSAHTGTGNLKLNLPFKSFKLGNAIWTGSISVSGLTYPAGTTECNLIIDDDALTAGVVCSGTGTTRASMVIGGSGVLVGSMRYLGQLEQ